MSLLYADFTYYTNRIVMGSSRVASLGRDVTKLMDVDAMFARAETGQFAKEMNSDAVARFS